jgi:hypothetical protein
MHSVLQLPQIKSKSVACKLVSRLVSFVTMAVHHLPDMTAQPLPQSAAAGKAPTAGKCNNNAV